MQLALRTTVLAAALAAIAASPAPVLDSITWEPDWQAALERAASENRIVFIAVNMDGERANERMVEDVYTDRTILELSKSTINVIASANTHDEKGECSRFGCVTCADHRAIDASVRNEVLKDDGTGAYVAPQHAFIKPDGTVLLSVAYEVRANELEWCFHAALKQADENYEGEPSKKARRPRRVVVGGVAEAPEEAATITREEALELIAEHKKGSNRRESIEILYRLITSDEDEVRDYVLKVLRSNTTGGGRAGGGRAASAAGNRQRAQVIRRIGEVSPPTYWEIVAEFADANGREQMEALVALEQLAAPESLSTLTKAVRRASDEKVRKNMLRAIGSVARDDKAARKLLLRESIDKKTPIVRANALIALGWLDEDEDVDERLGEAALPDTLGAKSKIKPKDVTEAERVGAIVAMGLTRGERWKELLTGIAKDDDELESVRDAAKEALETIEGKAYRVLSKSLELAGSDEIPRRRLFGRRGGGAERPEGGGRGRGGERGGDDGDDD